MAQGRAIREVCREKHANAKSGLPALKPHRRTKKDHLVQSARPIGMGARRALAKLLNAVSEARFQVGG
jgi:hypothetical protein